MKPQQELKKASSGSIFGDTGKMFEEFEALQRNIAARAFDLFSGKGDFFGNELDNWFKAEREFVRSTPVEITETEKEINVKAEVPGFTEKDIEVSVEPNRLILRGKNETTNERKEDEKVVYTERSYKDFFRSVDLPAEVDAAQVKATLSNGILNLVLPKMPSKTVKVEIQST